MIDNFNKIKNTFEAVLSIVLGITLLPLVMEQIKPSIPLNEPYPISAENYIESRSPKEILQYRYANGEIDSLEYLKRMVRL